MAKANICIIFVFVFWLIVAAVTTGGIWEEGSWPRPSKGARV